MDRLEDAKLVRGQGTYVDDITLPGMLHAAVLRSPHAHARIDSVNTSAALMAPGVIAILTGEDTAGVLGDIAGIRREGMGETPVPAHPVLARDRVMYVGQPVAIVVAEDTYLARDAVEAIAVAYTPLTPLLDPRVSGEPGTPPLHEHIGTNVVMEAGAGAGDVDAAFAEADRIVSGSYEIPRLVASPMECRGLIANYEPERDALTLWTSTQVPHRVKTYLNNLLPEPPKEIRVIAPDVGGGFGRKIEVWPEEVAAAHLTMKLGRPIKWIEERSENMVASHGRGYAADVEAAVRSDGRILGMKFRLWADLGAYFLTSSGGPLGNAVQRVAGPYDIPNMHVESVGVVTNKPPTGPYRGAGGPEAAVLIERTVDLIARELDIDPAELRKRNFIPPEAFPYTTATGLTYDSGNFAPAFDRALELAGYDKLRAEQPPDGTPRAGEPLLGVGVATIIKASGGKAGVRTSLSRVEISAVGQVDVYTDVSPHGQGTETSFAQITADALGVRPEDIRVFHGDTDMLESGGGTTSSRGLAVGGSALFTALQKAKEKIGDMPLAEVAAAEGGLVFEAEYTLPANPFAFAAHVAVVRVYPDTGDVKIERYVAVHDCGPMINPKIVRGQIQGGITQGIGQALSEAMVYDDQGQPLTGSFMTYGLPNAEGTPDFILENTETSSPTNPLGIKGIGETPTVAAPVAVANAVMDALGIRHIDMPLTPEKVWHAIAAPKGEGG
jgi:carbon-monoxide dehydrogenase large subunit